MILVLKVLNYSSRVQNGQLFRGNNYTNSTIIYTNDTHGQLGTLPYLISGVNQKQEELKNKAPLTLSSSDDLMYINLINTKQELKRKKLLVDFLNALNLDAMTIGNHELDNGLTSLVEVMKKAKFKLISTNTKIKGTPLEATQKSGSLVKSEVLTNKDGQKYGILGVSPIDEFSSEVSGNTEDFIAGVSINYYGTKKEIQAGINKRYEITLNAIDKEVKNFEKNGVNKVILLSHLGYEKDKMIVNDPRINGVDIIIGGHSHDKFEGLVQEGKNENQRPNVFMTPEGKPIIVTQAGSNAEKFGVLDVLFDRDGTIAKDGAGNIKGTNKLFNSLDFKITPKIAALVDSIIKNTFKDTPDIGIVISPIKPITTRDRENTLVTATLDGFLELANKKGTDDIKNLDIALVHGSVIRGSLNEGDLNEGELSLAFAFARPFYKVTASEKQIVDTITFMLEKGFNKGNYDIPHFSSNVKYELEKSVARDGRKLLTLSKLSINGNDIDINNPNNNKIFKIAVDDLYANTNYFGSEFNPEPGMISEKCTDKTGAPLDYVKGLADYLRAHNVDPVTKEITFDVKPKNITVVDGTNLNSTQKSFVAVA